MKNHGAKFVALVDEARARIQECNVDDVNKKLQAGENFHLIDVREPNEYANGHLPNAKHICKGMIEVVIEKTITDFDAPIILYCGGGFRSALAADNLTKMGYTNVTSMDGGWGVWNQAGYDTTTD